MHPLDSAWQKHTHAGEHLQEVDDKIRAFTGSLPHLNPNPVQPNINERTGEKFWTMSDDPPTPPAKIALMIGDVLYNLRSALDHLAWQLSATPDRRTAFLLCTEPEKWKRLSGTRLQGMSKEARALIKEQQPCFGTDPHTPVFLGWLEELSNVDKHRHLNLIVTSTTGGFWKTGRAIPGITVTSFVHVGAVEAGTEMARTAKENADVDFLPAFDVAFGKGSPAEGWAVALALPNMAHAVGYILTLFGGRFFPPRS